jgi:hypothetical protein
MFETTRVAGPPFCVEGLGTMTMREGISRIMQGTAVREDRAGEAAKDDNARKN